MIDINDYFFVKLIAKSEKSKISLLQNKKSNEKIVEKEYFLNSSDIAAVYTAVKEINCDYIPKVQDIVIYEDRTVIYEQYIDGIILSNLIAEHQCLSSKKVSKICLNLCEALRELHTKKIVHRDIKPSNIMMTNKGAMLVDYDAARIYKTDKNNDTCNLGTKGYAPPEQYGFCQTDKRADIYSLGVTLYECLTGVQFTVEIAYKGKLKNLINKCTKFNPDERFCDVSEIISYLKFQKIKSALYMMIFPLLICLILALNFVGMNHIEKKQYEEAKNNIIEKTKKTEQEKTQKEEVVKEINPVQKEKTSMALDYKVNQSEEDVKGILYRNGNGPVILQKDANYLEPDEFGEIYISSLSPETKILFFVKNLGNTELVNPKVNLSFNGAAINLPDEGEVWRGIDYANALGWHEVRWEPGGTFTIGQSSEEFIQLSMQGAIVYDIDNANIEVTISANNLTPQKFTIPIKLKN